VEPAAAPIVVGNPHLDEVIVAPRRRGPAAVLAEARLIGRLRRQRFDLAIDFHGGPRASLLTWLSGAKVRIGYDVAGRSWMYTRRVARPRALRARHSVENQWDLLEPLEIGPPDPAAFPVEMTKDPVAVEAVRSRLAGAGVDQAAQLIVVHVSAGSPFRRWPADSFAETVASLAAGGPERRVIVTSGPSDAEAADRVSAEARRRLGASGGRVVRCGELTLAELRALLDRAALYIGGDSGPLHVAATTRSPIVALYGPTLAARSAPWRPADRPSEAVDAGPLSCRPCDQRVCAPGDYRCLTGLDPVRVIAAAERLLGGARPG
jgi:ADP-heptose:LPS heptosyltransferase